MNSSLVQRVWLDVYPAAAVENVRLLTEKMPKTVKRCMTIKADGYGAGAVELARAFHGVADYFAVAAEFEALQLREAGIEEPVLILGKTWPGNFAAMIEQNIRMNIFSEEDGRKLSEAAVSLGKTAYVHFSLNTGMNRVGFAPTEESAEAMCRIAKLPGICVEGLFSHFATADDAASPAHTKQWNCFNGFARLLEQKGLRPAILHMANSATCQIHPERHLDMVRVGISGYGVNAMDGMESPQPLVPVMEFRSRVSLVKKVPAGEGISYGLTYVTPEERTIATVAVGYADGYCRSLSNCGRVLVRGQFAPVTGRVCMDQMMIDVTDIPGVQPEDVVTLVGRDGEKEIRMEEFAAAAGRLPHEVMVNLSKMRIPRYYHA